MPFDGCGALPPSFSPTKTVSAGCYGPFVAVLVLVVLFPLQLTLATNDGTIAYLRLNAIDFSIVPAKVADALAINVTLVESTLVTFGDGHSEMHLWVVGDDGQARMAQLAGWILSGSSKIAAAQIYQCEVVYAAAPTPAPPPISSTTTTTAPGESVATTQTPGEKQPISNGVILGAAIGASVGVFVISFAFSRAYIRWYEWKQRTLYSSASADDLGQGEDAAVATSKLELTSVGQHGNFRGGSDDDRAEDDNEDNATRGLRARKQNRRQGESVRRNTESSDLAVLPDDTELIPPRRISRAFERLALSTDATAPRNASSGCGGGIRGEGQRPVGRGTRKKRTIADGSGQLPTPTVTSSSRPLAPLPREDDGFGVSADPFAPSVDDEDKPANVVISMDEVEMATAPPADAETSRAPRLTIAFDDVELDAQQQFSDVECPRSPCAPEVVTLQTER